MILRNKLYPPKYWLELHRGSIDPKILIRRRRRKYKQNTVHQYLSSLAPHIQQFIFTGAVDRRKGEIRSTKFPISPFQYSIMKTLGCSGTYEYMPSIERLFELQVQFRYKGYHRAVRNVQFRLQIQRPLITKKISIHLLRVRCHQKIPTLIGRLLSIEF